MTLFMPPIHRKKKVDEKYNPDTFRVISEDAISDHPKYTSFPYRASFEPRTSTPTVIQRNNNALNTGVCEAPTSEPQRPLKNTRVLPQLLPDFRANKPQTQACGFLDKNVMFFNEPICTVYTKPVQHEEKYWWPSRPNPGELLLPPYAEDTNYRVDYNHRYGERPLGSGRQSAYMEGQAALGSVPVNDLREKDGSHRFYKERMSYEHMYNSRGDPNYHIRGNRHGAFVWSKMDLISQRKFIEYYQKLEEEERRRGQKMEQDISSPRTKANTFIYCSAHNKNRNCLTSKRRTSSSIPALKTENQDIINNKGSTPVIPESSTTPQLEVQEPAQSLVSPMENEKSQPVVVKENTHRHPSKSDS